MARYIAYAKYQSFLDEDSAVRSRDSTQNDWRLTKKQLRHCYTARIPIALLYVVFFHYQFHQSTNDTHSLYLASTLLSSNDRTPFHRPCAVCPTNEYQWRLFFFDYS